MLPRRFRRNLARFRIEISAPEKICEKFSVRRPAQNTRNRARRSIPMLMKFVLDLCMMFAVSALCFREDFGAISHDFGPKFWRPQKFSKKFRSEKRLWLCPAVKGQIFEPKIFEQIFAGRQKFVPKSCEIAPKSSRPHDAEHANSVQGSATSLLSISIPQRARLRVI